MPSQRRVAILAGAALATGISVAAAAESVPVTEGSRASAREPLQFSPETPAGGRPLKAATATRTGPVRPATAAYRLKWGRPFAADDFRGTRLNTRAWEVYEGPGNGGVGRRTREAVSVGDGVLKITGKRDGTTGGIAWMSGAQKRGRWEARVRMNRACACYNANLLLWPVKGGGGTDPKGGGGEIDYMETYGDNGLRKSTSFFLHYGPERNAKRLNANVKTDLRKWHAFAVEWTAKGITGYIDGRPWFRTTKQEALPPGAMGQAIQLDYFPHMRGLTAQGVNRFAPAILEVDWIRMYRP